MKEYKRSVGQLLTDYGVLDCLDKYTFESILYVADINSDQSSDAHSGTSSSHESSDTDGKNSLMHIHKTTFMIMILLIYMIISFVE